MEDLKLEYDMTVRNGKGKIVQFLYGDDGVDTCKIENQINPVMKMSNDEIYKHFSLSEDVLQNIDSSLHNKINKEEYDLYNEEIIQYIQFIINVRDDLIEFVNKNFNNEKIHIPVGFSL